MALNVGYQFYVVEYQRPGFPDYCKKNARNTKREKQGSKEWEGADKAGTKETDRGNKEVEAVGEDMNVDEGEFGKKYEM
jgi:hypothetical protein